MHMQVLGAIIAFEEKKGRKDSMATITTSTVNDYSHLNPELKRLTQLWSENASIDKALYQK